MQITLFFSLMALVLLSIFAGYLLGYSWRGSDLRKKRKARRYAIRKAARNMGG